MNLTVCPNQSQLERLVSGDLDQAAEAELSSHLEECSVCRERLERLTSASGVLPPPSPDTRPAAHAQTEAFVQRVVSQLESEGPPPKTPAGEPTRSDDASPLDDDWRSLLSPGGEPSSLGRLGNYEILEVLGRGGMGIVFRARDDKLGRIAALKVLSPQLAAMPQFRERFKREAKAAAAVSHPHVVTIYAVEDVAGAPLIAMEFVRGRTLAEKIRQHGKLPVMEILRIGAQAAQALAAAHAQGLIHRDIKPDNILLENGIERVKLTDFGLARAVDEARVTQSGMVVGTPQYMSPEQAQGEPLDARSDLFCLGCVLYAMAGGHSPFAGNTLVQTLHNVMQMPVRPLREINGSIPPDLESLIHRMLEKRRDRRPSSAAEVADGLTGMLARLQAGVAPEMAAPATKTAASGKRNRWPLALAALGLAAAVALGTIYRINMEKGTLVIEANDPGVVVSVDGKEVRIDTPRNQSLRLKPGEHFLQSRGADGHLEQEAITISRGEEQIVRVWFEPKGRVNFEVERPGEPQVQKFPPGDSPDTITQEGVSVDDGALKFTADEATTFRLHEVELKMPVDGVLVTYRARIKSQDIQGKAYLEMWVRSPGKGEFFSRGLAQPIQGTTGWASYETPFILQKGEAIDQVKLNLVIEGKGNVWMKDIELRREPLPKSLTRQ